MLKEAIIITGIPPTSLSGTGDLLLYLKNNIKFKIAWKPVSFLSAIKIFLKSTYNENCNALEVFKSLILYFTKVYPLVKFKKLKNKHFFNLYLFHPQSISYGFVNEMAKLRIIKGVYILDNSYFCFSSYNWLKAEPYEACTKCLQDENNFLNFGCKDFYKNKINEYQLFRKNLYEGSLGKVFVQNHSHAKLFSLVSKGKKSKVVGMLPQSLFSKKAFISIKSENILKKFHQLKNQYKFIVICHMNFSGAKGYFLIKEVSKYLKDICFILPFKDSFISTEESNQKNLLYLPCSWESGLKVLCKEADMVIVPSVWTIQVEGALLKSCLYAKRLVSIAESIIDKRDYLEGINYLSTTDGIEELAKKILNVLENLPNQNLLKSSLKKYIKNTIKTLDSIFIG